MLLYCIFHVKNKFRRGRILLHYYLPKTPRHQRGISMNDIFNWLCDRTIPNGKRGITVEAYRKSIATKLPPNFVVASGNELTASTYIALLDNAKED